MITRRRAVLAGIGGGLGGSLAGCSGRTDAMNTGDPVSLLEVESSISAAAIRWGLRADIWAAHDIDLAFDVVPYNRYNRQLVTGEADIGAPSAVAQLNFMADGEPLRFVGPQQNMFNRMFARADSTITDPTALAGTAFGVPAARSSTTAVVHRALVREAYGFDLFERPATVRSADPPVLYELLADGDLDAISEFSGYTIRGIADDAVRTIFDPYRVWSDRTGMSPPTTVYTVRDDYLAAHSDRVDRFLAAWAETLASFRSNAGEALSAFGAAAGLTSAAETTAVESLLADGVVFGPVGYDDALVANHWRFFELLAAAGPVALGDRSETFRTRDQLG